MHFFEIRSLCTYFLVGDENFPYDYIRVYFQPADPVDPVASTIGLAIM